VNEAARMGSRQRIEQLSGELASAILVESTGEQLMSEALTREALHGQVRASAGFSDVEDLDDVRMGQLPHCAGHSLELPSQPRIVKVLWPQQLHRHRALET
jgi:hypothetical protein